MRLSQLSWNWCCCMQILIKLLLNLTNAVLCVCYSRALWAVVPGLHSDQRGNIPLCSFWTKLSWKTQSREHSDTPCRLACSLVYGKMLTPVCISKLISFVFATHVYSPSMTAACNLHTRNAPARGVEIPNTNSIAFKAILHRYEQDRWFLPELLIDQLQTAWRKTKQRGTVTERHFDIVFQSQL